MRISTLLVAALSTTALSLTACSDESTTDGQTPGRTATSSTVSTAAPSGGPDTGTTTSTAPAAPDAAATTLAPVACPDIPREPTALESRLLVEPGPYAGDAFDASAAAAGARAAAPTTAEDWADAIVTQIQGDYASPVCEMIKFNPDLGDAGAGPTATPRQDESVGTNHFALVLDASGSMGAAAGSGTQMDEAKAAIKAFVRELPEDASVSLRIYGHEGNNRDDGKKKSCASSEVVFEGAPGDKAFTSALDAVQPVGWTPLARAIGDAEQDIPTDATDAIMYVVSDGLETCGGDPVAAAKGVADSGINPIINVIGFRVDNADQAALRKIAQAGGGRYTTAASGEELTRYWREEQQRLRSSWIEWREAEIERLQGTMRDKMDQVTDLADGMKRDLGTQMTQVYKVVAELNRAGDLETVGRADVEKLATGQVQEARDYTQAFRRNVHTVSDNYLTDFGDAYANAHTRWSELYQREQRRP